MSELTEMRYMKLVYALVKFRDRYDRLMKLNLLQLRLNISVRFIWPLFVTRLKLVSMFCLKNGSRCKRDIVLLFFFLKKAVPKNLSYFIFYIFFHLVVHTG